MDIMTCGVCGLIASGRNYNAMSCRPCMKFFRRNALKRQELECDFQNRCKVDALDRKKCSKCRLEKCFAIGMKKERYWSEEQNEINREGIEKNLKRRTNPQIASEPQDFTYSKAVSPHEAQDMEQQQHSMAIVPDINMCLPSTSSELPIRSSCMEKELSLLDRHMLEELIVANEDLEMPLDIGVNDPSLLDAINMTDSAIRRLVQMSKKIKGFTSLSQNDQIALLKYGCTELMILRSVMSYNPENDCWEHNVKQGSKMSIKVDILKEARWNFYEKYKNFINSFHPQWRNDENVMLILNAIVLFTTARRNLDDKEIIKARQGSYYILLQSYLDSVYNRWEANVIFIKLKRIIRGVHTGIIRGHRTLKDCHESVYLDADPNDVLPFLVEIYDLKD